MAEQAVPPGAACFFLNGVPAGIRAGACASGRLIFLVVALRKGYNQFIKDCT